MKYVYIIKSEIDKNQLYVGLSKDPFKRVDDHNQSKCKHTCKFKPWKLVYLEGFEFDEYAVSREVQIKKWSRGKKELLISGGIGR